MDVKSIVESICKDEGKIRELTLELVRYNTESIRKKYTTEIDMLKESITRKTELVKILKDKA